MIYRIAESRKMPVRFSFFVSHFGQEALQTLKLSKPFACYWKDTQEYECTAEVFEKLKKYETRIEEGACSVRQGPRFVRKSKAQYGYQQDAIEFSTKTKDVFLNFAQGMGKSLTTMQILERNKLFKTLIVCGQGNLQEEWLKDAKKHGYADALHFGIVGGDTGASTRKKIDYILKRTQSPVRTDLINIEALRNVGVVEAINEVGYDCIVVDEIQSAKGWKAEQTKGLHELVRTQNQMRIALSGTPVLNDPLEFFSLLKFFGVLKDTARTTFERYYGVWGFDRWGHYVCTGYRHLVELNELIAPILCYAEKTELNLPPKMRKRIKLDWVPTDEFIHLAAVNTYSTARLKKAGFSSKTGVRARMQVIGSTADSKIKFILDTFKPGEKALVFSQYTTVLTEVEKALKTAGRRTLYYSGELSMNQRLEVLSAWHDNKGDILLLSVGSARYGLNLIEATSAVFLEPPTSLAVLEQAEDRTHRIGQTNPVTSYLLIATEQDENALETIVRKQESLDELNALRQNTYATIEEEEI